MNLSFPLLPLIEPFKVLTSTNIASTIWVVVLSGAIGLMLLIGNLFGKNRYDAKTARQGFIGLGIAAFFAVVGTIYVFAALVTALIIWIVFYWIIWRLVIKNVIAAIWPNAKVLKRPPESEEDEK